MGQRTPSAEAHPEEHLVNSGLGQSSTANRPEAQMWAFMSKIYTCAVESEEFSVGARGRVGGSKYAIS